MCTTSCHPPKIPHHESDSEIPAGAQRVTCLCGSGATLGAEDEVRWLDAFHDISFPPVPFPSRRVGEIAGESMLRALIHRHHQRLRKTEVGALFPASEPAFLAAVDKSADFVVEACGGPAHFTPVHGPMRMRDRHFRVSIDERAREIWLRELLSAFDDVGFPDSVREEYWAWMEPFSIRMINRRTTKTPPRRHPYGEADSSLPKGSAGQS